MRPLLTLPHIFGTTVETIPAEVPYLFAEAGRVERWQERLAGMIGGGELRVGIAWQGNPHHQWDRFRSLGLERFAGLAGMAWARLVSLQRGPGVEQIAGFQELTGGRLVVPTEGRQESSGDLADTAAIMASLDLIITVDTATAHLAGALGREVWVALSTVTDWRWMMGRQDSPWYPTMRLFRQRALNGWEELMGRVGGAAGGISFDRRIP